MEGHTYVLDANVFIEAANRYYAFDLAPRFWECLTEHAGNGQIQSIDRVKLELRSQDVKTWAHEHFRHAFASTNEESVVEAYSAVMKWVFAQSQFSHVAKADFAKGADGWLVAYAKVKSCVIVTHEAPAPDAKRKVPIPNVCQEFDVPFTDTFAMLRQLGVRFV